ncbi:MAG: DNA internalization-related competence protein ComEC/Rec2 [Thermoanaerobaculia bacterium]
MLAAPGTALAAAVLLGTWLGRRMAFAPPGALVALALLGVGAAAGHPRRRTAAPGLLLVAIALSALNGSVRGGAAGGPAERLPGPDRPVTATVRIVGHWRWLGDGWSAPVRIDRLGWRTDGVLRTAAGEGLEPVYVRLSGKEPPPPLGSRIRAKGFLRRSPPLGNPPLRPPGPWRLQVSSRRLLGVEEGPGPVSHLAGVLRSRVDEALSRAPPDTATDGGATTESVAFGLPLARALLLGDSSAVPGRALRGLRRLGLGHLLAVSGLHVGLVGGAVLALGGPLPRQARLLLAVAAVGAYLLVVGPRPSLVRASVMAVLAVAALLVGRPPSAVNALGVAAATLASIRPAVLGEVGFQLSVGATAGLLLLGPVLAEAWSRGAGGKLLRTGARRSARHRLQGSSGALARLRDTLAVSTGAQLGTLPWALPAFCLLSPAAPLLNLLAVPWAGCLLIAAGSWTALALASPGAAGAALPVLDLVAWPFGRVADVPASPWLSLAVAPGRWAAAALALAVLAALLRPRPGLPLVLAGLAWTAATPEGRPEPVEAVVVDVGQGDAVLLRDGGETLLVDGGGWPAGDLGGRVLVPALARRGVRRLDAVLLTHADRDHCGGLLQLGSYLDLGVVLTGPGPPGSACDRELRSFPGVEHRTLAAGAVLSVGRWRLRVLHPAPRRTRGGRPGDNDASVVTVAEVFGQRLLLPGDAEAAAERTLVERWGSGGRGRPEGVPQAPLRARFLKVAHHGSRTSSAEPFLQAVRPALALVSSGARNPYGHPAPEVLARLARHGARVLRTDRDGMIVLRFRPDGRWGIDLPGAPK